MMEEFKEVPGYDGMYQISNFGTLKSFKSGELKVIKGCIRKKDGRRLFGLYNGYNTKTVTAAVVIMMAFKSFKPCGNGLVVDHIDNDCTNDRLDNLQIISQRENLSKDTVGTSEYVGVSWNVSKSKWRSQIRINKINLHLGSFIKEKEAGEMYQLALENIEKFNGDGEQFRTYLKTLKQ
jgi:hypothetical protein